MARLELFQHFEAIGNLVAVVYERDLGVIWASGRVLANFNQRVGDISSKSGFGESYIASQGRYDRANRNEVLLLVVC